jgi:hypothetical protein
MIRRGWSRERAGKRDAELMCVADYRPLLTWAGVGWACAEQVSKRERTSKRRWYGGLTQ